MVTRRRLVALLLVSACATPGDAPSPPAAAAPDIPPSLAEAATATYQGLDLGEGEAAVTLAAGAWQGEPEQEGAASRPTVELAERTLRHGDLDGDGVEESIVILRVRGGGTGSFAYLAVLDRVDGPVINTATRYLGDRVQLRGLAITDGGVSIEVVRAGEADASCCPGELATLRWILGPQGLEDREPPVVTGRLGLAALEGSRWTLDRLVGDSALPEGVGVTLEVTRDGFAGQTTGCNAYTAPVIMGDETPGAITLGPIAVTRMACPAPASTIEARYLELLEGVRGLGFMDGQLFLRHGTGILLFDAAATP